MMAKSLPERIEELFLQDGGRIAYQFLSMVGIGAAVAWGETLGPGLGTLAVGAAAGSAVLASAAIEYSMEKRNNQRLVDIYREELGALAGKSHHDVTRADLFTEASQSNPAIRAATALHARWRNFYITAHALTATLLTGGIALASFALEWVPAIAVASAAGAAYESVFRGIKGVGNALYNIDNQRTITREIRSICDQIGLGGRVSSTRVLGVFVDADPALSASIQQQFGDDYDNLTIAHKRDLVRAHDERLKLYRLTEDINTGAMNPTELAFIVYGQRSGVQRREKTPQPFVHVGEGGVVHYGPLPHGYTSVPDAPQPGPATSVSADPRYDLLQSSRMPVVVSPTLH